GAIFSGRIAKRIGVGPAIILGAVIFGLPPLPLPFVTSSIALPAIAILLGISFFGNLLYNINQVSFRPAIVPVALQGRLNATTPLSDTRVTPIARLKRTVRTPSFSAKIATEIPPIQRRLIEPEMNMTSMNSQQQPMQ